MRVALCFHGLVGNNGKGGKGATLNLKESFKTIKKYLIDANPQFNFDIFVHSWSKNNEDEILKTFKPINFLIDKQQNFENSKSHPEIKFFYQYISFYKNLFIFKKYLKNKKIQSFRAFSRWYSAYQVNKLKKNYETLNNFEYDLVMLLRMDLKFLKSFELENLSKKKFYCSNWNDGPTPENNYKNSILTNNFSIKKNYGLLDFWFISDSSKMNIFSDIYKSINKYKIDPHFAAKQHCKKNNIEIQYILYRFIDFELTRRLKKSYD